MDKAKFWEKQYRRGHGRIVGICYRYVNDWAVAQDLAQDVFLKAMETFKAYRAFGRFDAWLTRIAVNHCIDYLRQKPDFIALESEPAAERPDEDTEPIWTADFTEKELLETVQQLPELQRAVFNLYAIEGYSHRRIAGLLDISVANSKQLHHRARVRLGQMLIDKHKQKENKRKGLLMIPLLFILKRTNADSRRLDRLYRSKLSGLRMESAAGIVQTAATSPGKFVTAIAAHKATLLLVTAAGVTGGAVGWQVGRHHPVAPNPANDPSPMVETVRAMSPDTVASPDTNTLTEPIVATDSVVGTKSVVGTNSVVGANNYSLLRTNTETSPASVVGTPPAALAKTEETTNPDPVIITQKVPVRRTVVIRDTTIVSDTVYQVIGEQ